MDPQLTLQALIDSAEESDNSHAYEFACDLANWLRAGGFAPKVPKGTIGISVGVDTRSYALTPTGDGEGRWKFHRLNAHGASVESWDMETDG